MIGLLILVLNVIKYSIFYLSEIRNFLGSEESSKSMNYFFIKIYVKLNIRLKNYFLLNCYFSFVL